MGDRQSPSPMIMNERMGKPTPQRIRIEKEKTKRNPTSPGSSWVEHLAGIQRSQVRLLIPDTFLYFIPSVPGTVFQL